MKSKVLTVTVVFKSESVHEVESAGNAVQEFKGIDATGEVVQLSSHSSYISRQALRYSIVNQMVELFEDYQLYVKGSIQFNLNAALKDYFEIDLFGYKKKAVNHGESSHSPFVKISNARLLHTFSNDIDYISKKRLFQGFGDIRNCFYSYTLTVDLDKVGLDVKKNSEKGDHPGLADNGMEKRDVTDSTDHIDNMEKYKRVSLLLKAVKFLYRDINGKRESLAPLFIIGGVYKNDEYILHEPFFMNKIKLSGENLVVRKLRWVLVREQEVANNTIIGYVENTFGNDEEIKQLNFKSIKAFFDEIDFNIKSYYESSL